jgi:hypothetical protein
MFERAGMGKVGGEQDQTVQRSKQLQNFGLAVSD